MCEFELRKHSDFSDQKTNYDADTNTSDVEQMKNRRKQNFEDEGKQHAIGQRGYSTKRLELQISKRNSCVKIS